MMKFLIVDDEPLIRIGFASLIEDLGYEVEMAADASEAIALLERKDFEFVITDVDMPGTMDGIALANYVANRWPPIRLIVVSGKVALLDAELPASAKFLQKPCSDELLCTTIEAMRQQ